MKLTIGKILVILGLIGAVLVLFTHLFGLSDPHALALCVILVAIGVLIG